MATQRSGRKQRVIDGLIEIHDKVDSLLSELLPPCPECCPPQHPGNPGEIVDHGRGEISMCEHCWGRGYLFPEDEDDDE